MRTKLVNKKIIAKKRRSLRLRHKNKLQANSFSKESKIVVVITRSNKHITAQAIDYSNHDSVVVVQATSQESDMKSEASKSKSEQSNLVGQLLGKRLKEKSIEKVIFDRNGFNYHGRVKALAEGLRETGVNV